MRMFVAIDLDDRVKASAFSLRSIADSAGRSSLRFVKPEHLHLTLAFLGEVEAPRGDHVIAAMQEPVAGITPFRMAFGGVGMFPPRGAPRVLWLGVSEGATELAALHRLVARRLGALDVRLEDREFHPHLTIGRWRESKASDRARLRAGPPVSTPAMTVDHVTLYESRVSSEGPTHIERARALLASTS